MPKGALLPHWECLTVFSRVCTQKQPQSNLTSLKMFGTKILDNWRRSSRTISSRPDVSNPSRSLFALFPFVAVVPSGSAQRDGDGDKNNQKIPLCDLLFSSCAAVARLTRGQPARNLSRWTLKSHAPPDWTARREGQTFRSVTATVIDCCLFLLVVFGSACPKKKKNQSITNMDPLSQADWAENTNPPRADLLESLFGFLRKACPLIHTSANLM